MIKFCHFRLFHLQFQILIFQPNATGRKWQELFHQRFRTNETHSLSGKTIISSKVFYGDYHLTFRKNGVIVHTENIKMDQDGQNVIVNL